MIKKIKHIEDYNVKKPKASSIYYGESSFVPESPLLRHFYERREKKNKIYNGFSSDKAKLINKLTDFSKLFEESKGLEITDSLGNVIFNFSELEILKNENLQDLDIKQLKNLANLVIRYNFSLSLACKLSA